MLNRSARLLRKILRPTSLPPGRPRHLNDNVLAVPEIAVQAVEQELYHLYGIAALTIEESFRPAHTTRGVEEIRSREHTYRLAAGDLALAIARFAERIQAERLSGEVTTKIISLVRAAANARLAAEYCSQVIRVRRRIAETGADYEQLHAMEMLVRRSAKILENPDMAPEVRRAELAGNRRKARKMRKRFRTELFSGIAGRAVSAEAGLMLSDYPTIMERIAYHLHRASVHHEGAMKFRPRAVAGGEDDESPLDESGAETSS